MSYHYRTLVRSISDINQGYTRKEFVYTNGQGLSLSQVMHIYYLWVKQNSNPQMIDPPCNENDH